MLQKTPHKAPLEAVLMGNNHANIRVFTFALSVKYAFTLAFCYHGEVLSTVREKTKEKIRNE